VGSIWEKLEPLLSRVERPARYIDREWGSVTGRDASYRAVFIYPDVYEVGMANQAIAILYSRLNSIDGCLAERAYLPWIDMIDAMREEDVPLFSLESCSPVAEFDLVGVTLQHELTYSNVLEALSLAGIAIHAASRCETDPLVVGGGPCAYNPEPIAEFFDAFLIGEAEDAIGEFVEVHRNCLRSGVSRTATLRKLASVPGVYVPSHYRCDTEGQSRRPGNAAGASPDNVILKRIIPDIRATAPPEPVVPYMEVVHDRYPVEIMRGCARGCRFCQAGMIYRPVRERNEDEIVRMAVNGVSCTGYDEVSLTSLSTTDHSQIERVLRRLGRHFQGTGVSVSLPSLRADEHGVKMSLLASRSGRNTGLTLAPEAGTQRLRDVINKNVTEGALLSAVNRAFKNGKRKLKLYFMIGLPTETDEDILGIADLVAKVMATARESVRADQRGAVRVAVSVSTLVPKAHTPFQWLGQAPREEILRRQNLLRDKIPRKGVDLSWHDVELSVLEAALARGGRETSAVIEYAWRAGARFDAWSEQFLAQAWKHAYKQAGLDVDLVAQRTFDFAERLPWEHISCGVSKEYLWREWGRSINATLTPDCTFESCSGCQACTALQGSVGTVLAGRRNAG